MNKLLRALKNDKSTKPFIIKYHVLILHPYN